MRLALHSAAGVLLIATLLTCDAFLIPWTSRMKLISSPSLHLRLDNGQDLWTTGQEDEIKHRTREQDGLSGPSSDMGISISTTKTDDEVDPLSDAPDRFQSGGITTQAPAVLLHSGPGTGKSRVLSARLAYILQSNWMR